MSEETYIRGSGGIKRAIFGGPKNQEDANTLFSSAKAKVVDLISDGEISGVNNGKKVKGTLLLSPKFYLESAFVIDYNKKGATDINE